MRIIKEENVLAAARALLSDLHKSVIECRTRSDVFDVMVDLNNNRGKALP